MKPSLRLVAMLTLMILGTLAAGAEAATRYVAPCGNDTWAGVSPVCSAPLGPKRTIQAAINASVGGDQVSVLPGTYLGAINLNGKAVRLLGVSGPDVTVINGNGALHTITCTSGETAATIIEGFRITGGNAGAGYGGGLLAALASPTVINCQFIGNAATRGGGASLTLGSPLFEDCVFGGNTAASVIGGGGGVYAATSGATFDGCEFFANDGGAVGGAAQFFGGSVTLIDCDIHHNEAVNGGGVHVQDGAATFVNSTLEQNHADGGAGGGMVVWAGTVTMSGTHVLDNLAGHSGGGLSVSEGATLNIELAVISGNVVDPATPYTTRGGGLRVVNSTVTGNNLQIVGNDADSGGGVWAHDADVHLTNTLLWLNDASEDSGALGADAGSVITLVDVDVIANTSPVAAGIAVADASVDMTGGSISDHTSPAAAALSAFESTVHLHNVVIRNNLTNGFLSLGVVTLASSAGGATFDFCDFLDNAAGLAGGAVYMTDAHAVFNACEFAGNAAGQGGAIAADNLYGPNVIAMRACQMHDNDATYGGALSLHGDTVLEAAFCRLTANSAMFDGGAICANGTIHLVNCDVVGNEAESGAGIEIGGVGTLTMTNGQVVGNVAQDHGGGLLIGGGVNAVITNCTITGNAAGTGGSAMYSISPQVEIVNSIVFDNAGIQVGGLPNPDFRYSIVPAFQNGPGCFTANPQFVNPGVGDYRLAADSPARDAGNNARLPRDVLDLDGDGNTTEPLPVDRFSQARVQMPAGGGACMGVAIVDMGAHERVGVVPAVVISSADLSGDGIVDGVDLAMLLGAWGACADGCCIADLNADAVVDGADLAILLGGWG
ncbi:MAG: hypothetical protein KDA25_03580 [Phycisphaerales bacterium]|nr:hypothetical protein [Phycisphaerales bacterium]